MFDSGDDIILANWLNGISLKCTINNDVPIKLPDFSLVLVNRSTLCNSELEAEESFLLDLLAAYSDNPDQFKIYFTVILNSLIVLITGWIPIYPPLT